MSLHRADYHKTTAKKVTNFSYYSCCIGLRGLDSFVNIWTDVLEKKYLNFKAKMF